MVARAFKGTFNFVGFYDLRPELDPRKVYIGEFVSELVFPCGEIELGKGQCGLCASEERVMIAYDVKKIANYIACDDDTQSEIVLPCFITEEDTTSNVVGEGEGDEEEEEFNGDAGGTGGAARSKATRRRMRTMLDIDSVKVGSFNEEDQRGLEKIISLIYN